ncbi:DinB family protein [Pseudalkalibacillus hwajinpoensis]|uniref:DinB family protein n=1 Tax=Guptibacillus hwajinpoensis TaxID=208199 RepID=UPI00325ABECB
MDDAQLIKQFTFWRYRTIQALEASTEEIADKLPEGFSNTVRWNIGHILVTAELVLHRFTGMENNLPDHYSSLFKAGTHPTEWTVEPPDLIELKHHLLEQNNRFKSLEGKLNEQLENPFSIGSYLTLETVSELLLFLMNHENLHLGTISGIKRACGVKELWSKSTV